MRQDEKELLGKIAAPHGLTTLTSLRQEAAMEVRMMGMKGPSMRTRFLFDFKNRRGRVEFWENGKLNRIHQETAEGRVFWTAKAGTTPLGTAKVPFDFVPNMQTGLIGLLALSITHDTLQAKPTDAIGKRKGSSLTRTREARLMPVMQGRDEPKVEQCACAWTYLLAPDGTLLAERVVQTTTANKRIEQEFTYERFETVQGVKVPVELGVKMDGLPKMASVKLKVVATEINPTLSPDDFKLPS
ncbi:hypothetical protein [Armatimonas rosea]|uniref:Outer membrane lipoprotein-sorting protein n=1 Tax=Armatimonas rosea TaxID=685828 RepID=A0A7W9W8P7_ARMRO|nr:hypothetical protein [Armatimonas rosea]MBB6051812.1 hypothetical protein [Armatimonas rosea]